jgi:hypothetical protein
LATLILPSNKSVYSMPPLVDKELIRELYAWVLPLEVFELFPWCVSFRTASHGECQARLC